MLHAMRRFFAIAAAAGSLLLPFGAAMAHDVGSVPIDSKLKTVGGFIVSISEEEDKLLTGKAEIISISDTSVLLRDENGAEAFLPLSSQTQFRYLGGVAALQDFQAGDDVMIVAFQCFGDWKLRSMLNISVRHSSSYGKVVNLSADSFDLQTVSRGTLHVMTSSATKFRFLNGDDASFDDLDHGDKVLVQGKFRVETNTFLETMRVLLR